MDEAKPLEGAGHLLQHVLAFTYLLREMGVGVSPGEALELVRALEHVPITAREDFHAAARCTLIRRREDLPLFDAAFAFYWKVNSFDPSMLALPVLKTPGKPMRLPRRQRGPADDAGADGERPEEEQIEILLSYSAGEALRQKDFGSFSWEEVQACKALLKELRWRIELRTTRRQRPTPHGRRIDMRRFRRTGSTRCRRSCPAARCPLASRNARSRNGSPRGALSSSRS